MAVTRIWEVRGRIEQPIEYIKNPEKTDKSLWNGETAMGEVLQYATNPQKTEQQLYVSGINCQPESASEEFGFVKKQFGKEGGIICYHGYQSFAEGEVTPEQAHAIGMEFAQRVWGEDYQIVVSTHLNTDNLHNHFIVNSVSFKHGRRCRKTTWRKIHQISDEICREQKLSTIAEPKGKRLPYMIAKAESEGKPSRLLLAKEALDEAILKSCSLRELEQRLKEEGYYCRFDPARKYWTIRQKDWKKSIRIIHMGEEYSNDIIKERLLANQYNMKLGMKTIHKRKGGKRKKHKTPHSKAYRKIGGLRGRYLHYCYKLGAFQKPQSGKKIYYLYRDDLLKLKNITDETRLLCMNKIESTEELFSYRKELEKEVERLCRQRQNIYNAGRRLGVTQQQKENYASRREYITAGLRRVRRNIHLCDGIIGRSEVIKQKMKTEQEEVEKMNCRQANKERRDDR